MKIASNLNLKRKHEYDAGIDIPFPTDVVIRPDTDAEVIDLGLRIEIPKGTMGFLVARTSAAKKGLTVASCPIDSGYTGNIHAIVSSSNPSYLKYKAGESICQLVVIPILLVELTNENIDDTRASGAFGSTGK